MIDMPPQYAIYVTAGESQYNPKSEWGGYHITIAGFENHSEVSINKKADAVAKKLFSKGADWKPTNYTIKKWGKNWTIIIKSKTLRDVADRFFESGSKKVKGPIHAKTEFHITLPIDLSYNEAQRYAETLSHMNWYITIVESDTKNMQFNWCKYFPLKS